MSRQHQNERTTARRAKDAARALEPRVELVDNWHPQWANVLNFVDRTGSRDALHIDADGWLAARHNLLVAFIGETTAGHLCFRVQPIVLPDGHVRYGDGHKAVVEAFVECYAIDEVYAAQGIGPLLIERARARAAELHCETFLMEPTCGVDEKPKRRIAVD